eukprot:CAMPEP_0203949150 /NCGR_PEP_ID=MMETSP0359-20131031/83627_1 /ASSEMBLY_ACC=CAM_ASM_000338 /TAXON_ID=268821 /ORGANISM="Scrippsiella Hangoei, Strain SHTV-5" /LENGTH=443 /DNA_ID=CAMNT_0050880969 /DNA_START=149 /DNA_END=1477 /DNA_ORIENTATION=+
MAKADSEGTSACSLGGAAGDAPVELLGMFNNLFKAAGLQLPACKCSFDSSLSEEICISSTSCAQEDDQRQELLRRNGQAWDSHRSLGDMTLEYEWEEVRMATGNFGGLRKMGRGRFSTVYQGRLEEGVDVAVKVLEGFHTSDHSGIFEEEVCLLSRVRHPNVVMLLGCAMEPGKHRKAMVYELLPGGSCHNRLHEFHSPFLWQERLRTAIEMSRGLAHLHKYRPEVFHRDIKTAKILFSSQGIAKIADFGLACASRRRNERFKAVAVPDGTVGYAAPEYAETSIATEASEVYSAGMVLLELLTGRLPAQHVAESRDEWIFLLDDIRPDSGDAADRVLKMLDSRTQWPLPTAASMTDFALSCIHSEAWRRPSFMNMVMLLQSMSSVLNEPRPRSSPLGGPSTPVSPAAAAAKKSKKDRKRSVERRMLLVEAVAATAAAAPGGAE